MSASENGKTPAAEPVANTNGGFDKSPFDLVMAIVNKGYTDLVMEAARKAGARGGTISVARGTGNKDYEDFYGISIEPEKEVVFILVPRAITDRVLKAIYEEAGLDTNGQGIAFSVPAGYTVGLTAQEVQPEDHDGNPGK